MQPIPQMLIVLCPLVLLAGFVDSIAGGGGLISLPAYYLVGLPPALAAGTNKLTAAMGTALAAYNYGRSGKVHKRIGLIGGGGAFACSALGVLLMKQLPDHLIRWLVMGCILVAAFFTLWGHRDTDSRRAWSMRQTAALSLAVGCATGFYDGLIGPGTGTFLILLLARIFGLEAVLASGTAKIVNLASNLAALISLLITGDVLIIVGLPAGACAMLGAYLGSRLTIRKGSRFVRFIMLAVLGLLLAKLCVDMLG